MLLILTAVIYFGFNFGEAYFTFYRYQDRMKSEARFAVNIPDATIKMRIAAFADSLGLPDPANKVVVRRGEHDIFIYANYTVRIELPRYVREIHFNPSATGTF
ncbi:MAG: hypothetical protein ACHQQR_07235 [Gemmatimonadales bacterium]